MFRKIKEKLVNWLLRDIVINEIKTKKLIDKGNTLYVDIADFDHNTSDGTPTESQMWYNVTDHVLRYRNDTETIDVGAGTLTDDVHGITPKIITAGSILRSFSVTGLTGGADVDILSHTLSSVASGSIVLGVIYFTGYPNNQSSDDNKAKQRLIIGGVQVAEGPWIHNTNNAHPSLVYYRENMSGNVIILNRVHVYIAYDSYMILGGAMVGGGSIKL